MLSIFQDVLFVNRTKERHSFSLSSWRKKAVTLTVVGQVAQVHVRSVDVNLGYLSLRTANAQC
jgi:hypothetical protein